MREEWKSIKGYEGFYEVSNLGRVRSLDRFVNHSRNNEFKVFKEGAIKKASDNGNGYPIVFLQKDGRESRTVHRVHRLVAEAFIKKDDGKLEVDHIDRNKQNNYVSNLRWVTHKENVSFNCKPVEVFKNGVSIGKFESKHYLRKNFKIRLDSQWNSPYTYVYI